MMLATPEDREKEMSKSQKDKGKDIQNDSKKDNFKVKDRGKQRERLGQIWARHVKRCD